MKKQIFLTFVVIFCTLLVLCLYSNDSAVNVSEFTALTQSCANIPQPCTETVISPVISRLYFYTGLPFFINKIRLMSIVRIILISILIGLFIKPLDPKMESILESDGKK